MCFFSRVLGCLDHFSFVIEFSTSFLLRNTISNALLSFLFMYSTQIHLDITNVMMKGVVICSCK